MLVIVSLWLDYKGIDLTCHRVKRPKNQWDSCAKYRKPSSAASLTNVSNTNRRGPIADDIRHGLHMTSSD